MTGRKILQGLAIMCSLFLIGGIQGVAEGEDVAIAETTFPDAGFRTYLEEKVDINGDKILSDNEIEQVRSIDFEWGTYQAEDLSGLSVFYNLEELNVSYAGVKKIDVKDNVKLVSLDCSYNKELAELNVDTNVNLQYLYCYETKINQLNIDNNPGLIRLDCNNTDIEQLNVSENPQLFALNLESTKVNQIDVTKNPLLYEIYITDTPIDDLDVTNNPELVHIRVSGTKVTELDLSKNPKLAALYCYNTSIRTLDLKNNPQMYEIFCYNTPLTALDLSGFSGLHTVECYNTDIKELNLSDNVGLVGLNCSNTQIESLDLSNNPELQRLECEGTPIRKLDLSKNSKLRILNISNTRISNMENCNMSDKQALEELYCSNAGIKTLNIVSNPKLYSLKCDNNYLTELELAGCGELWFENTISPQSRVVYGRSENGKRIFDIRSIVSDLSRVNIVDSPDYTYDPSAGTIVLNHDTETEVVYTYAHEYQNGNLAPMEVRLQVLKQYGIVNVSGQNIVKDQPYIIEIEGDIQQVEKVLIDGTEINREMYSLEENAAGNIVLTLSAEWVNSLSNGEHHISIVFSDGIAEMKLLVPEDQAGQNDIAVNDSKQSENLKWEQKAARTSDTTGIGIWMLSALAAGSVICINVIRKRKIDK